MNYKCNRPDCGTTFHKHDQTNSQHKHGICPGCGVDDIREIKEVTMNRKRRGLAFHIHHDMLVEYCCSCSERVEHIKIWKAPSERKTRLRLFKIIPKDRLPAEILPALNKCITTSRRIDRLYQLGKQVPMGAYLDCDIAKNKLWDLINNKYEGFFVTLHKELCPNCPWNGTTIFPRD